MRAEGDSSRDGLLGLYDLHGEKLRYLVVGVWNTVFGYAVFAALLFLMGPLEHVLAASQLPAAQWLGPRYYLMVQWIAWVLSVPQSTLAFKYLVFRSKGHWLSEIGRSYLVYLPVQALSSGLLWCFSDLLGLHPLLGQFITVFISAVLSYLGHKNFTFKEQQ